MTVTTAPRTSCPKTSPPKGLPVRGNPRKTETWSMSDSGAVVLPGSPGSANATCDSAEAAVRATYALAKGPKRVKQQRFGSDENRKQT